MEVGRPTTSGWVRPGRRNGAQPQHFFLQDTIFDHSRFLNNLPASNRIYEIYETALKCLSHAR